MAHHSILSTVAIAGLTIASFIVTPTFAQPAAPPAAVTTVAPASGPEDALAQNFKAEHEIGRRFHFDPADLPAPKVGPVVTSRSLILPYNGQTLQVPPGFVATLFAKGLANPRRLLVLANGDVLVVEQSAGYVTLLRDDGEGQAKWISRHVEDLNKPYGLAWQGENLAVTDQDGIWRVPLRGGAAKGAPSEGKQAGLQWDRWQNARLEDLLGEGVFAAERRKLRR